MQEENNKSKGQIRIQIENVPCSDWKSAKIAEPESPDAIQFTLLEIWTISCSRIYDILHMLRTSPQQH